MSWPGSPTGAKTSDRGSPTSVWECPKNYKEPPQDKGDDKKGNYSSSNWQGKGEQKPTKGGGWSKPRDNESPWNGWQDKKKEGQKKPKSGLTRMLTGELGSAQFMSQGCDKSKSKAQKREQRELIAMMLQNEDKKQGKQKNKCSSAANKAAKFAY